MKHHLNAAIPEQYTSFVQLPNSEGHNAVWDFVRSPDGRFFVSVCGENEKPLTALLYEYYPESGELRLMFDVAKIWVVDHQQMPPSKIHTSIDFLPDGKLIMATHNTAPAPGHKQWMFEQFYEHPWEGYPGSILMIVDPDTNEVGVKGIPVPRESIYGGMLGNDARYYYFLGYMRGHFYRIDLETNEVTDYGKVSEFSSCRLVKDERGRFYGSSYTGGIWRYDPERDEIEDLKIQFQSPNGTKHRRQFIFALHTPRNTLLMVDNVDSEIIELHPETLEVTRHGYIHLPGEVPNNPYGIGGFAADENFVLYYGLKANDDYCPIRLVRWDLLNGGQPENLGLVVPNGLDSQYICEMIFDDRGILHMVDVCGQFSPYILAVDVKQLQPPGEDAPAADLHPYWEPAYNGVGSPAFMHIVADRTVTLPLHQHMDWKHTVVSHVRTAAGNVYTVSGQGCIYLTESDYTAHAPRRIERVYDGGAPVSCIDLDDRSVAVLTANGFIVEIDLESGNCRETLAVPRELELVKLQGRLGKDNLLASDREGGIHICNLGGGIIRRLNGLRVETELACLIQLDDNRLLLSGPNDELLIYAVAEERSDKLNVRTPSIRGRSFKATVTGGAVLADGTVVAGTEDGMLFTLSPDHGASTTYGRLYSSGELRQFIKVNDDEVIGVYGGVRDAGHVFHFSKAGGFVDLGRPRVIKDNNEVAEQDTEWADIHYISGLAYSNEDDLLCVASGEKQYGCVVRYQGVQFGNA
ncbi:hypothetical protein PAT3040_03125 [Paenibacillus agaridevorans]|uniref:Uncharacterized protein n=1 Tax=Paenibacillus agaridevorans TaxID=171404 RepID=A0A2R5EU12_9BACL|nr:hypothetical protein [Paenibacillus agaridevorans]GBG08538.1 hypothetical protein PAT3040_03125 [Paenibacillus agaridevorans]